MAQVYENVPSIEELQDGGHKIKEIVQRDTMHTIRIELDGEEYSRIGGSDGELAFARKLAAAAGRIIAEEY